MSYPLNNNSIHIVSSHPERPGDLDLFTLELVCNVTHGTDNQFWYFCDFFVKLWANTHQIDDMTLLP